MKPTVYLESSIISYLAARPSRNILVGAHQRATHDWWRSRRLNFDLLISEVVLLEIEAGDSGAAARRTRFIRGIRSAHATPSALALAEDILRATGLPAKAARDAAHIAIAAANHADFLLTWNCAHIANAALRNDIESACRAAGMPPPIICTPHELPGPPL